MPANPRPACHWPSWNSDTNRDSWIWSDKHQKMQKMMEHAKVKWEFTCCCWTGQTPEANKDTSSFATFSCETHFRQLLKAEDIPGSTRAAILSELLPASCFCGLSLAPVSWSSLCHISLSCPNTQPEQYSYGSRSNQEDGQGARWKHSVLKPSHTIF